MPERKYLQQERIHMKKKEAVTIKPGYLRPAAAAKYMGITVRTLSNWVRARMVAQIKPSNRVCLFRISDLDAALDRFRVRAIGEDWK
jgi:hypothetical protein